LLSKKLLHFWAAHKTNKIIGGETGVWVVLQREAKESGGKTRLVLKKRAQWAKEKRRRKEREKRKKRKRTREERWKGKKYKEKKEKVPGSA